MPFTGDVVYVVWVADYESSPLYGVYSELLQAEQRAIELYERTKDMIRIVEIPLNQAVDYWTTLEDGTELRKWAYEGNGFDVVEA